MTSRQRQSAASQRRPATVDIPQHQPLSHPLNPAAQRALNNLSQSHCANGLKLHLREASAALTEAAGLINDRYTLKVAAQRREERRRAKHGRDGDLPDGARAEEMDELQFKVEKITNRMEEAVRKTIDGQTAVSSLEDGVRRAQNLALSRATHMTQRTSQRSQAGGGIELLDRDEDESMADFVPSNPDGGTQSSQIPAPVETFRQVIDGERDRYQAISLRSRYAGHNDYIGFRRTVHDARHPDEDAPPLPNPSTWFSEKGAPAAGLTMNAPANGDQVGDGSEDDIAISRERISTRCPLTLQEFREPLTSRKCPHSFEKEAILTMIRQSQVGSGAVSRRGLHDSERAVQCPVPGCNEILTTSDLHPDAVLIRKIRRIQRSRDDTVSDDEDGEEHTGHGTTTALVKPPSFGVDIDAPVQSLDRSRRSICPKAETRPPTSEGREFARRGSAIVVVDLGGSDDSDEDCQ